ncbi:NifU family protein [Leekyejoonella antrihumi]|uniref:NifU family protein n=1 Tax=Leekyejoonella antrihumi TaxID=1660198 RepID=A0A563E4D3_9MICO|nr:NifU family protein [Leekyejoonella antrihumi]TWP37388.1 NifU family protein [Leekyejoonella antrihumi]
MNPAPVPMHPEATLDPAVMRWIIPAGTLPVVGEIADVPAPLGDLWSSGRIASITVETRAVLIGLPGERSWALEGAQVRDALASALQEPHRWQSVEVVTEDDMLRAALQDVLNGGAGDYIRSHGGEVAIVAAQDRRARVRMSGACSHCPAAGFTLHSRLESELRERFPQLVELCAEEDPGGSGRARRPTWLAWHRAGS